MLTRLPKCSLVKALPLEGARSKLGFLFRLGSKVTGRRIRCSLRLPQRVSIIVTCVIALVAEKKSSFPFRVCSYLRVVHLDFLSPSSCMVSTQRPVKGLVVASVRGTTLMTASLTFLRFSKCIQCASAIASDVGVSSHSAVPRFGASGQVVNLLQPLFNTHNECPCWRCCRGLRGRLSCGRPWN